MTMGGTPEHPAARLVAQLMSGATIFVDEFSDLYFDTYGVPVEVPVGISPVSPWALWARNKARERVALAKGFESFRATLRDNDIHSWALTLFFQDPAVQVLLEKGAGVSLTYGGESVCCGPMVSWARSWSSSGNYVTIAGVSWDVWLARKLVHPQPTATAPPYNVDAYDVFVDTCEDVLHHYVNRNMGPGAIVRRRLPNFTLGTSLGRGDVVLGLGRWDTVLNTIKPWADLNGIRFRVVELQETGALQFITSVGVDKSAEVRLSRELGNIESFEYGLTSPTATYAYVGGGGSGVGRKIVEVTDATAQSDWFGSPVEVFVNAQDTIDTSQLQQRGLTELAAQAEQLEFEVHPANGTEIQFMDAWRLGDTVSVLVDGIATPDTIRTVDLTIDKDGVKALPGVSTPSTGSALADHDQWVQQTIRRLGQRVTDMERV